MHRSTLLFATLLACSPKAPPLAPFAAERAAVVRSGARLVPQVGHNADITSIVFSPDDTRVVTTSADGVVILWHAATGAILRRFEGHADYVNAAALTPDGAKLVTTANDLRTIVWDAATGARLATIVEPAITRAVATDGERVVVADDASVRVYDLSGALKATLRGARPGGGLRPALAAGAGRAATPNEDGSVTIWDTHTGAALTTAREEEPIGFAALSADGAHLLTSVDGDGARPAVRDAATGAVIARLGAHPGGVRSASFVGDLVATVDEGGNAGAWTLTGRRLASVPNEGLARIAAAISPDGARLAVGNGDGTAGVWSVQTGKPLAALDPEGDRFGSATAISFDHRGGAVAVLSAEPALWSPDGAEHVVLQGRAASVWSAAFSPSGDGVLTGSIDGSSAAWSARTGAVAARYTGLHGAPITSALYAPDGTTVLTASLDQTAILWDAATGAQQRVLRAHAQGLRGAWFSPDGTRVVTAGVDGLAILWDRATGDEIRRFEGGGSWVVAAAVSADNSRVFTGTLDGVVTYWDAKKGTALHGANVGNALAYALSPDGALLAKGGEQGPPQLWDTRRDRAVRTLAGGHTGAVIDLAWRPDGRALASVGADGKIVVWDPATGAVTRTIEVDARGAAWSPDGKWLVTAHGDGTSRLWDAATGEERAALLTFADGSWAVVDRDGRFDASDDGDVNGLVWVIDGEPYELSQLRAHYYDPGLLAKVLGARAEPLRAVPALTTIAPPPSVRLDGPDATGKLDIDVEDRGGGVGELFFRLNGSDISAAVAARCPALATGGSCAVNLSTMPTWIPGASNAVEGFASVSGGEVRSRGTVREVVASGKLTDDPPDLWVVAVGTGDYVGDAIDLVYPPQDAIRFAAAMKAAGEKGFGADRTHVRVLSTAAGEGVDGRPSAAALPDLVTWLSDSDPGDTLVLYLSGHGVSVSDGAIDDYFYLMPDAAAFDDLRDEGLRALRAWSGTQIAQALAQVPALKRAVILDTCAAGKFEGALSATRDLSSDAVRAHARAQERTGAWFLAGAAADKVSYEASRFSQGLLTYTLLEGMRGPALADGDLLFVGRLFHYAEEQVPVYASGIGGVQQPITRQGEAGDFPIGELTEAERNRVPMALPRPVVVRAAISTADGRADKLGVAKAVNDALRNFAAAPDAPFVVWDSEPSDDTWQITGLYREGTGGLQFEGWLSRTKAGQTEERPLKVAGTDPGGLAKAVLAGVVEALK